MYLGEVDAVFRRPIKNSTCLMEVLSTSALTAAPNVSDIFENRFDKSFCPLIIGFASAICSPPKCRMRNFFHEERLRLNHYHIAFPSSVYREFRPCLFELGEGVVAHVSSIRELRLNNSESPMKCFRHLQPQTTRLGHYPDRDSNCMIKFKEKGK